MLLSWLSVHIPSFRSLGHVTTGFLGHSAEWIQSGQQPLQPPSIQFNLQGFYHTLLQPVGALVSACLRSCEAVLECLWWWRWRKAGWVGWTVTCWHLSTFQVAAELCHILRIMVEKGMEFPPGRRLNHFCKPLGRENGPRWRWGEMKFLPAKKACHYLVLNWTKVFEGLHCK